MADIIYRDESYALIGACIEVHEMMGSGFLESVYQECMELELKERGILFQPQCELRLRYKKYELRSYFKADFICFGKILLEIKAVSAFTAIYRAQVMNYLKATNLRLGILVNFNSFPKLDYERVVL